MSTTSFGVNDAMAVKLWSKEVAEAERDTSDISKLIGEGEDAIIQEKKDFSKGAGDQVTYALRVRIGGAGFSEGEKAQGNAQGLTFYSTSLVINELGQTVGVRDKTTIDAQRVPFDLRAQGKSALVEWWKDRKSVTFFNHVCGYTPANTVSQTSGPKYTGLNTVTAHTAGRRIWAGSSASADEGLSSNDTFTVALIDRAKELATTGDSMVRPISVGGQPKYVMYLDPAQVTSLRTNAGSGGWLDIHKAALMGGQISNNAIYTGAVGEWNNVVLRSSQDITLGVNSGSGAPISTVRRAVLLGAQAATIGFGKSQSGPNKYRWSEELFDHDRELELGAWSVWGLRKNVYNAQDFGAITVSTYAVRQS